MKHKFSRFLVLLVLLLGAGSLLVLAAYSPNGRELVSLGYLEKTFFQSAVEAGAAHLTSDGSLPATMLEKLEAIHTAYNFRLSALDGSLTRSSSLGRGTRFKRGDVITLGTGTSFLLLAGESRVTPTLGLVVDTTEGTSLETPTELALHHRYLAAEQTVATVTISSDTAVLSLEGGYGLSPSSSTDYNMLADAMKAMGLFKGSDTGYGSGYDLEKAPTRIQGLIMFLRLLGEEPAALSTTASNPFTDVPAWCQPYVSYAYEKGYTKGISDTEFGPTLELGAAEYLTFVLRALGYRDSGETPDFVWNAALVRSLNFGVINAMEHKLLTEQPFLRAQVVYLSYHALDARMKGSATTLYGTLTASGALDKAAVDTARQAVTTSRIR